MHQFRIPTNFQLDNIDPTSTHGWAESYCEKLLAENSAKIAKLQNVLYAEAERSLLIVLQSMDTGGKDPIIRDVLSAANPQACRVTAFKKPSDSEEKHDRFYRFHKAMPAKGEIGVFNRSYFDGTIVADAHRELDAKGLERDYKRIGLFEQLLVEDEIDVIKIYLHMSKAEQKHRLEERIGNPERHWELSEADFSERKHWDGYMRAYENCIRATDKDYAPWYVIPADRKWFRDAAASVIIVGALEKMNPQFPPASMDLSKVEMD